MGLACVTLTSPRPDVRTPCRCPCAYVVEAIHSVIVPVLVSEHQQTGIRSSMLPSSLIVISATRVTAR